MTKHEVFVSLITMLCEGFGRPQSDGLLELYWLALGDLSEVDMKVAIGRAALECKFMPSPAELRGFVRPSNPTAEAAKAWGIVRRAIDTYDWDVSSIDFGPRVNAVIRNLGGWDTLCQARLPELDNPGWLRKRFEEIYLAFGATDPQALRGEPLEGKLPPNWRTPRHVLVPMDGSPAQQRIEGPSPAGELQGVVRDLAEAKS